MVWPRHSAVLTRTFSGPTAIADPHGGIGTMTFGAKSWTSAAVHVGDVDIRRVDCQSSQVLEMSKTLNVSRLRNVRDADKPEVLHRITYAGASFNGFPHIGLDRQTDTLQLNTLKTTCFGRNCVIRSATRGSGQLMTVSYEGERLNASEQRSLWILLGYFTGPRLEIVSYEGFDASENLVSLEIPNGGKASPEGQAPLITGGPEGESFAQQFPGILERFHADLTAQFPWHVIVHHLQESNSFYPETAIKNLHVALDSLIEAQVVLNEKARIVSKSEYKVVRDNLLSTLKIDCDKLENGAELYIHLESIINSANHRGTQQKRKMFWEEFKIDVAPFVEVLRFRDPALHQGHVLDYSTDIDYLAVLPKVHDLRTLVNRAILKRLGYVGQMYDFKSKGSVEV